MKRLWLYISLPLAVILLLVAGAFFWLFGTTAGARFVIDTVAPLATGMQISTREVRGRLWDRLHLGGVKARKGKEKAQVDAIDLSWEPRELFHGDLVVSELAISGVRVQDDTPRKPPQLRWPRLKTSMIGFEVHVRKLRVHDLSYRRLDSSPIVVDDFSSSLALQNGMATISELRLSAPQGSASGELVLGLWRPSLRIDLAAHPVKPLQGMDLFSLQGRLFQGKAPEQLAGPVALAGKARGVQRLEVTGEVGMTTDSFNVRRLTVTRPGRRGSVTGEGKMTLTVGEPLFNAALKLQDLDLAKELKRPARITGKVNFSGTLSKYAGSFALSNVGPGWQTASLAANFKGTKTGATLSRISGRVIDGTITGGVDLLWSRGIRLKGKLSGRHLNPGRVLSKWSGLVNLDLSADIMKPKRGALTAAVNATLLESRLHGQNLRGAVKGAIAGQRVTVERLLLVGSGFNLRGSGVLDRRLELTAQVSDLSRLVPKAAGELDLSGWVRWRDHRLAGSASGRGANLAFSGVRAAALQLDAALGEGKGYPVQLAATATRLAMGRVVVERALLSLKGTAARHTLDASLFTAGSEAHLALSGAYRKGSWQGELTRLDGRDAVGPFALAAPARLAVGSAGITIAPLVINGQPGERVELAGEMRRHPNSGELRGSWSGLNLARANAWLEGVAIQGGSSGSVSLRLLGGDRIAVAARVDAQGTVVTDGHQVGLQRVAARVEGDGRGLRAALDLWLERGGGEGHLLFTSSAPATLGVPREGDFTLQLANFDLALLRPVTPSNLKVEGMLAGMVRGSLAPGRRLTIRGNTALDKGHLLWQSQGNSFDASINTAQLTFDWRGREGGGKLAEGILQLSAQAAATGTYTANGRRIAVSRFNLRADADQHGTRAALDMSLDQGGALRASVSSSSIAGARIPETGEFAIEWGGIDPALLKPLLPVGFNLEGNFAGEARGKLLPGKRVEANGEAVFSQGRAQWQATGGEMNANLRSATLSFAWGGETLTTSLNLALAQNGHATGTLVLPIPARLPIAPVPEGRVHGSLTGRVQEKGLLTSLMPGLVQETHGLLDLDLSAGGTWNDPLLEGRLQLSNAGAYIPSAGITLSNVSFLATLQGDQIRIDDIRATSGSGTLEGDVLLRLKGWRLTGYSGRLSADRFQTVFLPELQMWTSPRLTFQGGGDTVTIRGEVRVPQMVVAGPPVRPIVTPSKDVVLEGAPKAEAAKKFPLVVDGRIHVVLGDKVQVKASGIDATLGGEMDLVLAGLDKITSSGEIRVLKGSYKAYGLDLTIERGRLYYANDPVTQPTLDILALRTIGDVKAGVTVGGYLRAPVMKLYSEPSMPEVDILAYMLLGHPLATGTGTDQASALAMAASGLLSFGQSESVQEQIKDRLGLSVLGVETFTPSTAGLMGYKEISVTPTGAPSKAAATQSLLTVGKYITPKLYLSYGRSLVTGGSLFILRYDIFQHWQVETQSGSESGADLYYKLEFD